MRNRQTLSSTTIREAKKKTIRFGWSFLWLPLAKSVRTFGGGIKVEIVGVFFDDGALLVVCVVVDQDAVIVEIHGVHERFDHAKAELRVKQISVFERAYPLFNIFCIRAML